MVRRFIVRRLYTVLTDSYFYESQGLNGLPVHTFTVLLIFHEALCVEGYVDRDANLNERKLD